MSATMSSTSFQVRSATIDQQDRLLGTLVLAFASDPMARWAFADPRQYLLAFPQLAQGFGGSAFAHGTAHCIDGYSGAALWLPPGVGPDEPRIMAVLERFVPPGRSNELLAVLEQMESFHPHEPHWYLPMVGVDPARQGHGRGTALLRHALEIIDRDGAPAYLESSSPANIPLYERHGFRIMGTIQAGSSPPLYPMLRPPQ